MDLQKAIKSRHTTHKFKPRKPAWQDIIECIEPSIYAPMAGNLFTPQFIIVDDEENIKKISDATTQDFVADAKYLIVVCSDPYKTISSYGKEGEKYNKQQVGAAIQNILLTIEEKGLATCWVGYFAEEIVRNILGIPEEVNIEAILPVGYEREKPKKKAKISLDECLYFNKYGNQRKKPLKKFDV